MILKDPDRGPLDPSIHYKSITMRYVSGSNPHPSSPLPSGCNRMIPQDLMTKSNPKMEGRREIPPPPHPFLSAVATGQTGGASDRGRRWLSSAGRNQPDGAEESKASAAVGLID